MKYDPQKHRRRSMRLKGYDYTQAGAYFVTICAHRREHIFGEVVHGKMKPTAWGETARAEWFKTAELRPYVELDEDEFVVMPNHIHGIIRIADDGNNVGALPRNAQSRAEQRSAPTKTVMPGSLGAIVRAYKSAVTYAINTAEKTRGSVVWQSNYYEHIVRNERELNAIRQYIIDNPRNWKMDRDNLENLRKLPPPEKAEEYLEDIKELLAIFEGKLSP
jgi:REP element-mobilizing transposase RayT